MVTYVFAIYVCQAVSQYLKIKRSEWVLSELSSKIEQFGIFGDLWQTMLTVFMSYSGGMDWGDVMDPLLGIGLGHGILYLVFFMFTVFGMINVVTGLFVDASCTIASSDRDALVDSRLEEQRRFRRGMAEIFYLMDPDQTGTLSMAEFKDLLGDERIRVLLATLGLSCNNALQLFTLLDEDCTGNVSIDGFLDGCEQLRGPSKNIDVVSLRWETRKISSLLSVLLEHSNPENWNLLGARPNG